MAMVKGAKFWNDRSRYYIQTNNAVEKALRRYKAAVSLVTCGPTAMVNCLAALGREVEIETPGAWNPQPEDLATLWFHDERNWNALAEIRPETSPMGSQYSPHEIPQYYPACSMQVFGVPADFQWIGFDEISAFLEAGNTVQICRKSPGHFLAAVSFDLYSEELIVNDPNPVGGIGFNIRISRKEFVTGYHQYGIVYQGVQS
jgi:hypothetical protein